MRSTVRVARLATAAALLVSALVSITPAGAAPPGPPPPTPQLVEWKWQGTATTTFVTDEDRPCAHTTGRGEFTQQVAGDTSYFAGSADALTTIDGGAPTGSYTYQRTGCDSNIVHGHTTRVTDAPFIHVANIGFDSRNTQTGVISYHWSISLSLEFDAVETDSNGQSRNSQVLFWTPFPQPSVSGQVSPTDTHHKVEATWFNADTGTTAHTVIDMTLTVPSCRDTTAAAPPAGRGFVAPAAVQAAAEASCLTIDSPTKNANVALTDPRYIEPYHSRKPAERERAPTQKSLVVTGTITCGCPVTLNGVAAIVKGTTWIAQLPDVKPGKLTLTATAGKEKVAQDNTLLELRIVDPAENSTQPITIDPHLPDIAAHASVDGLAVPAATSLTWTMKTFSNSRSRAGWSAQSAEVAKGTALLADPWHPTYTKFAGGWARLEVSATLPGVDGPVTSDPRWFDVPGTNPSAKDIIDYTATKAAAADVPTLSHIFCHESTYTMFRADPDPVAAARFHPGLAEPASTAIPADWRPNPAALRPLFGGPPAGIGVAQKDPASWPDQQWDWHANVDAGVAEWAADIAGSRQLVPVDEQRRVRRELTNALGDVHQGAVVLSTGNAQLPPLPTVPDITTDQHRLDAISRYNAGAKSAGIYAFDSHYAVSDDKRSVIRIGSSAWIHRHDRNLAYVQQVLRCPGAQGPGLNPVDPAAEFGTLDTNTVYVVAAPGEPVEFVRSNLAPGAPVDLNLHSQPISLGTFDADGSGTVHATITIPTSTPTGNHILAVSDGNPAHDATIHVFVVAGEPAASEGSESPNLAATGPNLAVQAGIATTLLFLGLALTLRGRRSTLRRRQPTR